MGVCVGGGARPRTANGEGAAELSIRGGTRPRTDNGEGAAELNH